MLHEYENPQPYQEAIAASDMLDAQAVLTQRINDANFSTIRLDPNTLYCSKTGQPVGKRDANAIYSAIQIIGKNAFIENAFLAHGLHCAPAWIASNGAALDRLEEQDPVGYAAFCLGLITEKHSAKAPRLTPSDIAKRHYSLARAYAIISNASSEWRKFALIGINSKLCEFITYAPDSIRLLVMRLGEKAKYPDHLAQALINGVLAEIMQKAIETAAHSTAVFDGYKRAKYEETPTSPADAARGPSNIRQQKRSRKSVEDRQRFSLLKAQFEDFGFAENVVRHAGKSYKDQTAPSWQDFTRKTAPTVGLDDLANMDFSDVENAEDFLANEVEIRTISKDEAEFYIQETLPAAPIPDVIRQVPAVTGISSILASLVAKQTAEQPAPVIEPPKPVNKQAALLAMLAKNKGRNNA